MCMCPCLCKCVRVCVYVCVCVCERERERERECVRDSQEGHHFMPLHLIRKATTQAPKTAEWTKSNNRVAECDNAQHLDISGTHVICQASRHSISAVKSFLGRQMGHLPQAQVHVSPGVVARVRVVTRYAEQERDAAYCALLVSGAPQDVGLSVDGQRRHEPTRLVSNLFPGLLVCVAAGAGFVPAAILA
jgi:hypothetical protein